MSGQIRLLLVGKTGSGKSSTANTLLGQKKFRVGGLGKSVTQTAQTATTQLLGKTVEITDSPGLCDTGLTDEEITLEVVDSLEQTYPGPHAVIFVMNANGRFTAEEYNSYQRIKTFYGPEVKSQMIVLLTRGDDLKRNDESLQDVLKEASDQQKTVFRECDNRIVLFDNTAQGDSRMKQIQELFQLIDRFCGSYYDKSPYRGQTSSVKKEEMERRMLQAQEEETRKMLYVKQVKEAKQDAERKREAAERARQEEERKKLEEQRRRKAAEKARQEEERKREAAERQRLNEQRRREEAERDRQEAERAREEAERDRQEAKGKLRELKQRMEEEKERKERRGLAIFGAVMGGLTTVGGALLAPVTNGASLALTAAGAATTGVSIAAAEKNK